MSNMNGQLNFFFWSRLYSVSFDEKNCRLVPPWPQPAQPPMEFIAPPKCRPHSTCSRAFCMRQMNVISKLATPTSTKRSKDTIALNRPVHWRPSNICCCVKLCSASPTMSIKLSAVNWWVEKIRNLSFNIFISCPHSPSSTSAGNHLLRCWHWCDESRCTGIAQTFIGWLSIGIERVLKGIRRRCYCQSTFGHIVRHNAGAEFVSHHRTILTSWGKWKSTDVHLIDVHF